jgi:hypothetical protein
MGVSRYQQTLAEKGLHMGPRLTLVRVEQCLQQGKAEAERLRGTGRTSTAELEECWRERPLFASSVVNLGPGQFVIGKGAVLIVIDGTVVGAVGVSGGIHAAHDHTIAEAAVRAE